MEDIIEEGKITGAIEPITKEKTKKIVKQMERSICKIYGINNQVGTGFFCNIKIQDKIFPVLITNYHIIDDTLVQSEKELTIQLNDDTDAFILKLSEKKKLYSSNNKKYDIMIIDLREEENKDKCRFLELDDALFNKNSEYIYKDKSIYILHYPNGHQASVSYGYGIEKKDNDITHRCNSENGSSGSPIFNLSTNKVIGIHKCFNYRLKVNMGTLLKDPLLDYQKVISSKRVIQKESLAKFMRVPVDNVIRNRLPIKKKEEVLPVPSTPFTRNKIINDDVGKKHILNHTDIHNNIENKLKNVSEILKEKKSIRIVNTIMPNKKNDINNLPEKKIFLKPKNISLEDDKIPNLNINDEIKKSEINNNKNYLPLNRNNKGISYSEKNINNYRFNTLNSPVYTEVTPKNKVSPITPYNLSTPVKNIIPRFSYRISINEFKSGNNRFYHTKTYNNSNTNEKREISKNPNDSKNFYNSKHDINNTPNYNANNKNRLLYSNPSTPSLHGRLKNKKPKLEVFGGNNLNDAMMLTIDFK